MPRYGSIKQRKLLILFRMGNLPVGGGFLSRELPGQKLLFQPHAIHHFSLAGDKIFGAFQHHTDLFQMLKGKMGASAALYNPHGRFRPDAGNAQKVGILSRVDLHRKQLHMAQRPVAFRVELCMKVRVGFIEQFIRLKTVEAEQPVCLIKAVFPKKRRLGFT